MMDARPPTQVSARGTEPFGLFTFRAPEGLLSRKWRGLQSDIIKEQMVLDAGPTLAIAPRMPPNFCG